MRFASTIGAALALLIAIVPASSPAAGRSLGQQEYENRCASCHGVGAKGGGWMAKYLKQRPSSLTQLRKRNGGKFPYDYVYQIVDGRKAVELHGPRDMPVWGSIIPTEVERKNIGPAVDDEYTARARIRAMVEYLADLQE